MASFIRPNSNKAACDITDTGIRIVQCNASNEIISTYQGICEGIGGAQVERIDYLAESIWEACHEAEKQSGVQISRLSVALNDPGISSVKVRGSSHVDIGSEGFEKKHVAEAEVHALQTLAPTEKTLIYSKEAGFLVDKKDYLHNPIGICGKELTMVLHLLFSDPEYCQNVEFAIERSGRILNNIYPAAIAASRGIGLDTESAPAAVAVWNSNLAQLAVINNGAAQTYSSLRRHDQDESIWAEKFSDKISQIFHDLDEYYLVGDMALNMSETGFPGDESGLRFRKGGIKSGGNIADPEIYICAYGACLLDGPGMQMTGSRIVKKTVSGFNARVQRFVQEYFG